MNGAAKWMLLALLAIVGFGCVAQPEYDKMRLSYLKSREQMVDLQRQLEEARARNLALQEANRAVSTDPNLTARLEQALSDKTRLERALADLEGKLRTTAATYSPLPGDLSNALDDLAQQYPDLFTYDARRGMLKMNSDLTFDLGSTDVKAAAQQALAKLAQIVQSSAAAKYEAMIVGHTDNVPISRPDTRAKHPTNWHLSVHRAIAVKDALGKAGVPQSRMLVAGYGEYRPVVANAGNRGAAANRRVEIFLVPSTAGDVAVGPTTDWTPQAQPLTPEPIKDGAAAVQPRQPVRPVEDPSHFK